MAMCGTPEPIKFNQLECGSVLLVEGKQDRGPVRIEELALQTFPWYELAMGPDINQLDQLLESPPQEAVAKV